jgi:hypothetical protein
MGRSPTMEPHKRISLQDFKNWISEQKDLSSFFNIGAEPENPYDKYVGKMVRTKVGKNKLMERVESEDNAETLIDEFIEEGGTILCVEDKRVHIEVDSGEFYVPRFCVKIVKDED